MQFADSFKNSITDINDQNFDQRCLEVFDYQYNTCTIYQQYCNSHGKNPKNVHQVFQIPFLPIEFFKNHAIKSGTWKEIKIFKSSGTTKTGRSQHHVKDLSFYQENTKFIFESMLGDLVDLQLLAILPSYQEQGDSSLITMVDFLMSFTQSGSGYFLNDNSILDSLEIETGKKKVLFGVSYALLDLSTEVKSKLSDTIIIETGGMKGRKAELTREELHDRLKEGFGVAEIWSEYGMSELFSQAYGVNGHFRFPKWAKTLIREVNDPFHYMGDGKTGGINIIDLANIDSCAFIETKDLGRSQNGTFEVLGRFDNSDVRGCNLMIQRNM